MHRFHDKITVRVPATSANLGPGFDCVGIALDLWNHFELYHADTANTIIVENHGEGAQELPQDDSHLVIQTMAQALGGREAALAGGGWRVVCHNQVPCRSGLGSSSTAVLAGVTLAQIIRHGEVHLSEILTQAARLEGHPDNVAPAVYGGLVVAAIKNDAVFVHPIPVVHPIVVVCVPDFHFLTHYARTLVPDQVSRADTVFNMGRALLVVESIRTGNDHLLAEVMEDHLHEPFRLPHIPGAAAAKSAALDKGAVAVCLSGAGPGLLAFARDHHDEVGQAMKQAFEQAGLSARYWVIRACTSGLMVEGVACKP